MPFSGYDFDGFCFFNFGLFLCFANRSGVNIICQQFSRIVTLTPRIKKTYFRICAESKYLFLPSYRYLNRHNLPPEGVTIRNKPPPSNNDIGLSLWFCFLNLNVRQWNDTLRHMFLLYFGCTCKIFGCILGLRVYPK